jgi:tRNA(Ile)-lysidine synthase
VIPLISSVRETILRHHMLSPRDRVLAGVSGGADSTALLLALRELGYEVAAAHLNHGLRGKESDEDEDFVKTLAGNIGVPCFTRSVKIDPHAGNIEAAGREARRSFFQSLVAEQGFTKVALAHNREDRAETFLLHLLRGAGSEGLVSMAPVAGNTVRPLIETPRAKIQAYLESKGQPWRTDRTNADISFARNRIRQKVLPELASLFNTRLVESLTRTITILQDEDQWMRDLAQAWLDEYGRTGGLDVEALRRAPAALARRLIREALRRDSRSLTDLTFDHVEAVRGLLEEGKSGKTIQLPAGLVATREFNRLVLTTTPEPIGEFAYDLPIPGTVRVPELGRVFRATCLVDSSEAAALFENPARALVDGSKLPACVKIRNWRPGDYYDPAGWPAGKVKKLFQRARVPRSQRRHWPIFVTESEIVWVTSFPVSREFTPSICSKKIVAFEALEG